MGEKQQGGAAFCELRPKRLTQNLLSPRPPYLASFLFLYFSKTFFTEIYFQFHNLQFYTPTARQGGGRGPTARLRGGRHPAAPCRAVGTYM